MQKQYFPSVTFKIEKKFGGGKKRWRNFCCKDLIKEKFNGNGGRWFPQCQINQVFSQLSWHWKIRQKSMLGTY